ncbi:hypothetical protein CDAR_216321 [Caerostris darwini]|uniref:Uncharacterized protein n=1 Tax=Caerostris darwini TaxID=1538125 RepID=A0AAV4SP26_9ARAC|nr:hypothetical protein CDAR_216321 [Caerostris darwini]
MGVILPSSLERYSQLTESTCSISCGEDIEGGSHLGMSYKDRIVAMVTGSIQANEASGIACSSTVTMHRFICDLLLSVNSNVA